MSRLFRLAACGLALCCAPACVPAFAAAAAVPEDGAPYVLPDTHVHTLHAAKLNRDYQVFVSLPHGYAPDGPPLPVVFVTDADYAFPLVRAIAARVGGHSRAIRPFILVGLSYALGDTPEYSRRRDYTPTVDTGRPATSDMPGRAPRFGEAEGYRAFLASDVLPLVGRRYKVDWSHAVFVGHSYGSLLGTHILLASPTMFSHYVLSSPSLWYDRKVMFAREKAYAATHDDLKANVFFAVGGLEQGDDMVGGVRAFDAALRAHRYPGLRTRLRVFEGMDHLDVYPDMITAALKWLTAGK